MNPTIQTLARIAIGLFFIVSGLTHIAGFEPTPVLSAGTASPLPDLLVKLSLAVELGGGILLLLGYRTKTVILSLAVALFFATTGLPDGNWFTSQPAETLSNVAIAAGLVLLLANGAGRPFPWSVVPDMKYRKATVK